MVIKSSPLAVESEILEKGSGNAEQLGDTGWDLLQEEVSFPIAVINQAQLLNNAHWMQQFSNRAGVKIAPHGKTTMAPELFKLQIEQGAWGMSLATVPQVINAYQHGIHKIILANQLVGKYHCQQIVRLHQNKDVEFYCFVDSVDNVQWLGEFFADTDVTLNVLIELGVANGRCGCRDLAAVSQLAQSVAQYAQLSLAGLSFYEGVIHGDNAQDDIIEFIDEVKTIFYYLHSAKAFSDSAPIITGAGSAWYDIVAKQLSTPNDEFLFTPIIRPGCYLIHDTGIYHDAQQQVIERSQLACDIGGDLISSLTVWAYVHSVPEDNLAIVGIGKRDVAFDAGLPQPELHYRSSFDEPVEANKGWTVTKIMDQHCMMTIDKDDDIKPGDIICFSTSHPCLTMDKWRKIGVINDKFIVTKQLATYF